LFVSIMCCSMYFLFVLFYVLFVSIMCCSMYLFVCVVLCIVCVDNVLFYVFFVLFYVLFACKCVLLPPGVNTIAVKYIISCIIKTNFLYCHF